MNTRLTKLFLLVFCSLTVSVQASHIIGTDIRYTPIDSLKYKVQYIIYRECSGIPLNTSSMTFKVSCTNGSNATSISANRVSVEDISEYCKDSTSPCVVSNTPVAFGIEKHVFETTIDFSQTQFSAIRSCCKALISMTSCCRSGSITNISPGTMYVEAMLDLCYSKPLGNYSPVFNTKPYLYLCCNQARMISSGVSEQDGDSLDFELVSALNDINSPEVYTGNFSGTYPVTPYCPGSPGTVNCTATPSAKPPRGFYFDKTTGDFIFTPTNCNEVSVVVVKVSEYRRDATGTMRLVGYTKRESAWFMKSCGNNFPPYFTGVTQYSTCEGQKICFDIVSKDDPMLPYQTVPDTLNLYWAATIPGTTVRIMDSAAREKTAQLCWQTQKGDGRTEPYRFTVDVIDNNCPIPIRSSRTYSIKVKPQARVKRIYTKSFKGLLKFESIKETNDFSGITCKYEILDSALSRVIYISNNCSDSFRFDTAGRYCIQVTVNNPPLNCPTIYMDTIHISASDLTGIKSSNFMRVNISPNPVKDILMITGVDIEGSLIEIYDASGKLVLTETLNGNTVDLKSLSAGTFVISIRKGDSRCNAVIVRE